MTEDSQEAFEAIINDHSPEIQELARATRALIYEVLPGVVEIVWTQQGSAGYGTGPKKMSEHFSWIIPYKKHVNLGFNYGSELPDPTSLLEGSGKLMRHVKIRVLDDLRNPALRDLIEVATTHRVPPLKGS